MCDLYLYLYTSLFSFGVPAGAKTPCDGRVLVACSNVTAGPNTTQHNTTKRRCIDFLREKAECVPPAGVLSEAEEAAVSRSLELLRFLLESFQPVREFKFFLCDALVYTEGFPVRLAPCSV